MDDREFEDVDEGHVSITIEHTDGPVADSPEGALRVWTSEHGLDAEMTCLARRADWMLFGARTSPETSWLFELVSDGAGQWTLTEVHQETRTPPGE